MRLLLLPFATALLFGAEYEIVPEHSSVLFSIKHMMMTSLKGEFDKFSGNVTYDPNDLTASKLELTIDAASVSTHDAKRDKQFKSADLLNVAEFPVIRFKSTRIERSPGSMFITGDLTIKDTTRQVVFTVEGPAPESPDGRSQTTATTRINRRDWGLNFNALKQAGGVVMADEVLITLNIEVMKKAGP